MRHSGVATAALGALLSCAWARAAELELAGYLGYTLPFYEQTFPIDLRPPGGPIQGIRLQQVEPLRLKAKGAGRSTDAIDAALSRAKDMRKEVVGRCLGVEDI